MRRITLPSPVTKTAPCASPPSDTARCPVAIDKAPAASAAWTCLRSWALAWLATRRSIAPFSEEKSGCPMVPAAPSADLVAIPGDDGVALGTAADRYIAPGSGGRGLLPGCAVSGHDQVV